MYQMLRKGSFLFTNFQAKQNLYTLKYKWKSGHTDLIPGKPVRLLKNKLVTAKRQGLPIHHCYATASCMARAILRWHNLKQKKINTTLQNAIVW